MCLREWPSVDAFIEEVAPLGIIWDFDGVLCNTGKLFRDLILAKLRCNGFEAIAAQVNSVAGLDGRPTVDVVGELLATAANCNVERFASELVAEFELTALATIPIEAAAIKTVGRAVEQGRRQCIVSNGRPELIRLQLARVGIERAFDPIVTPTQDLKPKPSPAMYEHARRALGLRRDECLVIEDSDVGVVAAQGAGLRVLKVALF